MLNLVWFSLNARKKIGHIQRLEQGFQFDNVQNGLKSSQKVKKKKNQDSTALKEISLLILEYKMCIF